MSFIQETTGTEMAQNNILSNSSRSSHMISIKQLLTLKIDNLPKTQPTPQKLYATSPILSVRNSALRKDNPSDSNSSQKEINL